MAIHIPIELIGLAIATGVLYMLIARERQKTANPRACFQLAALWSIWTLVALIYTLSFLPLPSPVLGEPRIVPTPETMFSSTVYFVFLPALAVWVLMMLDLIAYLLKTRYRFRAATLSESKQVEALSSL